MRGELPSDWEFAVVQRMLDDAVAKAETVATRKASQNALEPLGPALPELLGGSADLTGSNLTDGRAGRRPVRRPRRPRPGNYVNFGVREFGMARS
jgi:transketolase